MKNNQILRKTFIDQSTLIIMYFFLCYRIHIHTYYIGMDFRVTISNNTIPIIIYVIFYHYSLVNVFTWVF